MVAPIQIAAVVVVAGADYCCTPAQDVSHLSGNPTAAFQLQLLTAFHRPNLSSAPAAIDLHIFQNSVHSDRYDSDMNYLRIGLAGHRKSRTVVTRRHHHHHFELAVLGRNEDIEVEAKSTEVVPHLKAGLDVGQEPEGPIGTWLILGGRVADYSSQRGRRLKLNLGRVEEGLEGLGRGKSLEIELGRKSWLKGFELGTEALRKLLKVRLRLAVCDELNTVTRLNPKKKIRL